VDEDVVRSELRDGDDFVLEGVYGLAETRLPDDLGVHAPGDFAERRALPEVVELSYGGHEIEGA
jgi:hypothetical protein